MQSRRFDGGRRGTLGGTGELRSFEELAADQTR
jgi:hypothetical protein